MAKKDKEKKEPIAGEETAENVTEEVTETVETNPWEEKYNAEHDAYLRLAAEFDNFRKRTVKEKDASYGNGKADAVAKLLPVYDNLERALNQETADIAYKKGVEMTMNELVKILTSLGVEIFGQVG
jgi:molecular chaperone GrpE